MKLELDNNDINKALTAYVDGLIKVEGNDVSFNLIAGRGENGNRVEVTVVPEGEAAPVAKKQTRARRTKAATETPADKKTGYTDKQLDEQVSEPTAEDVTKGTTAPTDSKPENMEFDADGEAEETDKTEDPDAKTDANLAEAKEKVDAEIADDDEDLFG